MSIEDLQRELRRFAADRDWEQFHTPKNLAMALSVETSELVEIFQWLTPEESASVMNAPTAGQGRDELADVAIYLLRLTDVLDVDLEAAIAAKIVRNAHRYTVEKSKGSAAKSP